MIISQNLPQVYTKILLFLSICSFILPHGRGSRLFYTNKLYPCFEVAHEIFFCKASSMRDWITAKGSCAKGFVIAFFCNFSSALSVKVTVMSIFSLMRLETVLVISFTISEYLPVLRMEHNHIYRFGSNSV